jgi:hypothetical protein
MDDAMAALNTDFASEVETCGSDTENASDTATRRMKAGIGSLSNKSVGRTWRSVDVSEQIGDGGFENSLLGGSMSPLFDGYHSCHTVQSKVMGLLGK